MKSLSDSIIFNILNKNSKITKEIKGATSDRFIVSLEDMGRSMDIFRRKFKYPLTLNINKDLSNMLIIPIYSKTGFSIPAAIPSWLAQSGSNIVCYVNLSNRKDIKIDSEKSIDGDFRLIYTLLQNGYIMLNMYKKWSSVYSNYKVMKELANAYMLLFRKVLDKSHAIKVDDLVFDRVSYMAAKFFLINQYGKAPSTGINDLAYSLTNSKIKKDMLMASDENGNEKEIYKDISTFIDFLSKEEKSLKTLILRSFYLNWISLYGASTIYAIELPQFLGMMIANTVISSREVRAQVIEKALDSKESVPYAELATAIS